MLQRNARALPHTRARALHAWLRSYRLAKAAFRLAMDDWAAATLSYRRARRRARAFRHELYRARREVRIEWR